MARSKNKKSSRKKKSGARSGGKGAARARAAAQTDEPKSRSGATGAGKEPAAEKESRPRTGSQRKWLLTVAALAVLAPLVFAGVYFKVSPSRDQVFAGPEVVLVGADSYYHLRHTRAAANNGIQRYDIGTHYPTGQRSRNAAIFDSIAAIAASWTADGDSPSDDEVATALAWLPPIMAGLVLLGLFGVGLALGSRLLGLTIAAAAICYPGEMAFKMLLGFGDHHAWEAVLLVIITLALGAALHVREPRHAASWAAGAGAVLAILGLSWAGTPLLLLLFAYSPLLVATIDIAAGRAPTRARHTGAIATGAFALITAMAAILSPDSVLVPSLAWLAIAGALGVCAAFGLSAKLADWIRGRATVPRLALSLGLAVLPVLALIAAASAVPAVGAALEVVFSKVSSIAEHQGKNLWLQFGPLAALAPITLLATAVAQARSAEQRGQAGVAAFAGGVVLVHAISADYGYLAAPMMAVLGALAAARVVALFGRTRQQRRRLQPVVAIAAAVVLFAPVAMGWTAAPAAERRTVAAGFFYDDAWRSATTWLRTNTEPTIDIDDSPGEFAEDAGGFPYPEGSYGVAVPWSFGNFVAAKGRRPVTWSQGADRGHAQLFTANTESQALERLCPQCRDGERVRYLIVDSRTAGPQAVSLFGQAGLSLKARRLQRRLIIGGRRISLASYGPRFHQSLVARLYLEDGNGMHHFRLAYETPEQRLVGYRYRAKANSYGRIAQKVTDENRERLDRVASAKLPIHTKEHGFVYDASIQPAIKIFEVVDGATLTGRTEPGTEVVASAEIHTPSGRRFPYQVKAEAGSDGRFELVVPYPSGVAAGARALAPYRLQLAGKPGEIPVAVSAEQVRKGARIDAMAAGRRPEPTATIPGVTTSPK